MNLTLFFFQKICFFSFLSKALPFFSPCIRSHKNIPSPTHTITTQWVFCLNNNKTQQKTKQSPQYLVLPPFIHHQSKTSNLLKSQQNLFLRFCRVQLCFPSCQTIGSLNLPSSYSWLFSLFVSLNWTFHFTTSLFIIPTKLCPPIRSSVSNCLRWRAVFYS